MGSVLCLYLGGCSFAFENKTTEDYGHCDTEQ